MAHAAVEELLKRCGSMYKLVVLAAKRAKELADGAPPLVKMDHKKVTSIALEEIRQGKVLYKAPASEETAGGKPSKGRGGTRAKEKKRAAI